MAVRLRKDGRWAVYCRGHDGLQVDEYFRHETQTETHSCQGGIDPGRQRRRPRCGPSDPALLELAGEYHGKKDFNEKFPCRLRVRLAANLIPHSSHLPAANSRPADIDDTLETLEHALPHPKRCFFYPTAWACLMERSSGGGLRRDTARRDRRRIPAIGAGTGGPAR